MQLSPQHYAAAWYELLAGKSKKERHAVSQKALYTLYHRGRLHWLPQIVNRVEEISAQKTKGVSAIVTASRELTEKEAGDIAKKVLGEKPSSITIRVNESLIGGAQVETKNNRWDLSIGAQLPQLSKQLKS